MSKMLNLGLSGCGRQMVEHRLPALLSLAEREDVNVVALCDPLAEAARRMADAFPTPSELGPFHERGTDACSYPALSGAAFARPRVYSSLQAMLAAEELDAVVGVLPHRLHAEQAMTAMQQGVHFLGEKPMANTLEEARAMVALAQRSGLQLGVGYQYGYAVAPWAYEMLAQIGTIRHGRAFWHRDMLIPESRDMWSRREDGVTADLTGHPLSAVMPMFAGTPVAVEAQVWNDKGKQIHGDDFQAADTLRGTILFSDGARLALELSWANCAPPEEQIGLELFGTRGRLEIPLLARELDASRHKLKASYRDGDETVTETGPPAMLYTEAMVAQMRNWVRAIHGTEPLRFTSEHALNVDLVGFGLKEAITREGEFVTLA